MSEYIDVSNPEEVALSGGNITPVVRIGATVRRTMGPWSTTVHHLLTCLHHANFTHAPRFLGIDHHGREVLSFLPGDVGFFPYIYTDMALQSTAKLLRQFHDVTRTYIPPPTAQWQVRDPDWSQHEVICHNDFAPYNIVFKNHCAAAIIDFDTAGPGRRLWDVAYAVYWFVPLYAQDVPLARGLADLAQSATRLHRFCAAYGCPCTPLLLDIVDQRLQALCLHILQNAERGEAVYQRMIIEGHIEGYQRAIEHLRQSRPKLDRYILEAS